MEFVTCSKCKYGRNLGGTDYGCRNKERQELIKEQPPNLKKEQRLKLVNKAEYSCNYAEELIDY